MRNLAIYWFLILAVGGGAMAQDSVWNTLEPSAQREFPSGKPGVLEAWLYTDEMSYSPGQEIVFRVHSTAPTYSISIYRDGLVPLEVFSKKGLEGKAQVTPETAARDGAGWKESLRVKVSPKWPGGVYVAIVTVQDGEGRKVEGEHFFVVREDKPGTRSKIAVMLCTSTYVAYNDWGGANYYRSVQDGKAVTIPEPILSTQRPWARGFSRLPSNVPRSGKQPPLKPFDDPRYPFLEWAMSHGYSRHYADAGWAHWERHFALWAEAEGIELEFLTQQDLHESKNVLDDYDLLVIVGHDEYWTWEMRDALDRFVARGGNMARFAGNFAWQVRIESEASTQVCYKSPELDPLYGGDRQHLTTTLWDNPVVGRPAAQSMGLTANGGAYHRLGGANPRGLGGYTVYRPDHWVFEGTDLYYGDVFGQPPVSIVSYEVDGLDYTFRRGLPYPTFDDGAPESTLILAMTPAIKGEEDHSGGTRAMLGPLTEFDHISKALPGGLSSRYGSSMISVHTRGKGTVVNAGTTSWVNGLIDGDFFTEQITRNVLRRLAGD